MAFETIVAEKKENIGIITLNRPDKLNAMSRQLISELDSAVTGFEQDNEVRVIIMTGAGKRRSPPEETSMRWPHLTDAEIKAWIAPVDPFWHWANCKKPTIGALNGLAFGGGSILASILDIRIGCERSTFRFLGATYGRVIATWTLPQLVGLATAKELLFTARLVSADEALRIGLLNKLVLPDEVMTASMEYGKVIAGNYPQAVQALKDIINRSVGMGYRERYDNERQTVAKSVRPPHPRDGFADFLRRTEGNK